MELDGEAPLDLALDGADEVDPGLGLIKGGGGALLREKIVITAARRFVVVAETPKRVERLGERIRLPVEVVRFGWPDTRRRLAELLPDPALRPGEATRPLRDRRGPPDPRLHDPERPPTPPHLRRRSRVHSPAWWSTASSSAWPSARCSGAPTAACDLLEAPA